MRDYDRLEELLQDDKTDIGGLRLLDGQPNVPTTTDVDVLPLVPLNESQLRAVSRIPRDH